MKVLNLDDHATTRLPANYSPPAPTQPNPIGRRQTVWSYTDNVGGVQNADGGGRLTTASVLPPASSTASYPLLNAA